jgi:hypothetical protein
MQVGVGQFRKLHQTLHARVGQRLAAKQVQLAQSRQRAQFCQIMVRDPRQAQIQFGQLVERN